MEHKKYQDIERFKEKHSNYFNDGDIICIQEKIDGANCSVGYDEENNLICSFSRRKTLDLNNGLNGFYEFSQTLNKDKIKELLGVDFRIFGEWLVPHTVKYQEKFYKDAYFYDIYSEKDKSYILDQEKVKNIVKELGLNYVPTFYTGKFISWEHIQSFIGKTEMGIEFGEGVVVKNLTNGNYVKLLSSEFQEVKEHKIKEIDWDYIQKKESNIELCKTIVTKVRINKIIQKMIEDDIIPYDWDEKNMGTIAKNLTRMTYEDCVKEESEIVLKVEDFGKILNKIVMSYAREILSEK